MRRVLAQVLVILHLFAVCHLRVEASALPIPADVAVPSLLTADTHDPHDLDCGHCCHAAAHLSGITVSFPSPSRVSGQDHVASYTFICVCHQPAPPHRPPIV